MKNILVGQVAEYFDDKVEVVSVDHKTFDLDYADFVAYKTGGKPPSGFSNRPHTELVDMGEGLSGTMSNTAVLREKLVVAALNYTAHVLKMNGFPGHSSVPGHEMAAAARAVREATEAALAQEALQSEQPKAT